MSDEDGAAAYGRRFKTLLEGTRNGFLFGALTSLVGFAMPWFKWGERSEWWYGGWRLMWSEGLPWIAIVFAGYALLVTLGYLLLDFRPGGAWATLALSVGVVLTSLVVVSIATADAIDGVRSMDRVVWGLGLAVMLLGHAGMVSAAVLASALWGAYYLLVGEQR